MKVYNSTIAKQSKPFRYKYLPRFSIRVYKINCNAFAINKE